MSHPFWGDLESPFAVGYLCPISLSVWFATRLNWWPECRWYPWRVYFILSLPIFERRCRGFNLWGLNACWWCRFHSLGLSSLTFFSWVKHFLRIFPFFRRGMLMSLWFLSGVHPFLFYEKLDLVLSSFHFLELEKCPSPFACWCWGFIWETLFVDEVASE